MRPLTCVRGSDWRLLLMDEAVTDSSSQLTGEMVTIVGIDEAGYGPLLGPLVVSAVAFDVPLALLRESDPAAGLNLWTLLKSSIAKRPNKRGSRLAVADSKILYDSSDSECGLKLLERAALVF